MPNKLKHLPDHPHPIQFLNPFQSHHQDSLRHNHLDKFLLSHNLVQYQTIHQTNISPKEILMIVQITDPNTDLKPIDIEMLDPTTLEIQLNLTASQAVTRDHQTANMAIAQLDIIPLTNNTHPVTTPIAIIIAAVQLHQQGVPTIIHPISKETLHKTHFKTIPLHKTYLQDTQMMNVEELQVDNPTDNKTNTLTLVSTEVLYKTMCIICLLYTSPSPRD